MDLALTEWLERPHLSAAEEFVVATHEAGHAVCALFCPHAPPIERISIAGDMAGSLGYVRHQDPAHRYVITRGRLLDHMCVMMGGREAELLLLDDLSIGSAQDLAQATEIARALVEEFGMGGEAVGLRSVRAGERDGKRPPLSPAQLESIDKRVRELLEEARQRAAQILADNRGVVEALRDLLVEQKTVEARSLAAMVADKRTV